MIYEPRQLVPCVTPLGDGYVWYIKSNGFMENDEVAVIEGKLSISRLPKLKYGITEPMV